ncbi:ribulose-phosphate 3-epimerase [bacterium]|nr:ribulose-phosphate 3-epimerase [bacterium]MCI0607395.1 ribulose-phosphate 3-epimerase [bacterium]
MTRLLESIKESAPTISAGIISADLLQLGSQISALEKAGIRMLHIDVMDGCFVPQMTVGPPFIKALKTPLWKDAHLMIQDPLTKVADYVAAGADLITVHLESDTHIHRVLQQIRLAAASASREVIRGIALNPGTPLETLEPLFDELEIVLLLAINPGWGGQKLQPTSQRRLVRLKEMIAAHGSLILTAIDGGITRENIQEVGRWRADLVISGSAIFERGAIAENASSMLNTLHA